MTLTQEAILEGEFSSSALIAQKRPVKLTNVRWITEFPPYGKNGVPLMDEIISLSEINRVYSIADIIGSMSFSEHKDVPNVSVEDANDFDNKSVNIMVREILKELSDCRSREYVLQEQAKADKLSQMERSLQKCKAQKYIGLLYRYKVDLEFLAVYIESLRLRNIEIRHSFLVNEQKLEFEDVFKEIGIDLKDSKFSCNNTLILPQLDPHKASKPIEAFIGSPTRDLPSFLIKKTVSIIGQKINSTGEHIVSIGKHISEFGKRIEDTSVVNNFFINSRSLFAMNVSENMQQTNSNSAVTINKPGEELPKNVKDLMNIGYRKILNYVPGLVGFALAVAVLNGNSTFHEMKMTEATPEIVQILHSVNEAVYKRIQFSEPAIEISTTGEVKGTVKIEPRSEPKLDNATTVMAKESQIQKDFYQAITRFDSNDSESIKQLDTLSVTVETILNAQKALGYKDLIVPDDILLKAKQKLSDTHSVVLNDTLVKP